MAVEPIGIPQLGDCFCRVLDFLAIDERIEAQREPTFSFVYDLFFRHRNLATRRKKALGINYLEIGDRLCRSTRRLCERFHLFDYWRCSNDDHVCGENFSSSNAIVKPCDKCSQPLLLCILKYCDAVEALDLRGVTLTVTLLEGIVRYCPDLCCLRLNFSKFDSLEAFQLFVDQLCPKIRHLSIDNLLRVSAENLYTQIFSKLINLDQAEIILFPNSNLHPSDFKSFASDQFRFLSLHFYRTITRRLKHDPSQYLKDLNQSKAKSICYFKIKSNYAYQLNYDLFCKIKQFHALRAVNLNFMNYFNSINDFRVQNCWPELESLTLDLWFLKGSNKLLSDFIHGNFHLKSLRLLDCRLKKKTLNNLSISCSHLSNLSFVDVKFNDVGAAFDRFHFLKQLEFLYFEYSLKDEPHSADELRQLEDLYRFPLDKISKISSLFRSSHTLREVKFINWPGLTRDNMLECEKISQNKNISLYLKQY